MECKDYFNERNILCIALVALISGNGIAYNSHSK